MGVSLGIIGSGNIGQDVARLAVDAGVAVVMSNSRGPESITELTASFGSSVRAATVKEAIAVSDIVILALPIGAVADLLADDLRGKIVVDATNYYPAMFGPIEAIDRSGLTSSEFLQDLLPGVRLVKALNNVDFLRLPLLARAAGSSDRSALPVAGDDVAAKAAVISVLDQLGFDVVDLGPLSEGWRSQPGTPIYVTPYSEPADPAETDPTALFMNAHAVPVPVDAARALIASASRG
ncbi:NADPH-dependent F420 reductase [Curtobacterium flaccumfaciens]|uniref:NADPH-dependent F420 reductase n=1 Tax=Curtobacterium flaccumfaciens TaxID=2035 RepID=UPI0034169A5C